MSIKGVVKDCGNYISSVKKVLLKCLIFKLDSEKEEGDALEQARAFKYLGVIFNAH